MKPIQSIFISSATALFVWSATASAALNTSIANGDFATNDGSCFDGTVDNWSQRAIYAVGIWAGCSPGNTYPSNMPVGSIIATSPGANRGRMFQSLGTVDASDVGKVYTLTGGAVMWDWLSGSGGAGNIVASFRSGTTTSAYGTVLGKASTVYTAVNSATANTYQDGVGDDGPVLKPFAATFVPTSSHIGTTVYAVVDLNSLSTTGAGGERRYIIDNVALTVTITYSGLASSLNNGGFTNTGSCYDPLVRGWMEHEDYGAIGPSGSGAGTWACGTISGATGHAMTLIPTGTGANKVTVMQSIGIVNSGDVGKMFTFSCGTRAWDWLSSQTPFSGTVTASFRTGMSPDGETVDFTYGTQVGTAGSTTTALTSGINGAQDGLGDGGPSLIPLTATFTPAAGDVGKEVFVAINLDVSAFSGTGENRYVVDNATLSAQWVTTTSLASSANPSFASNNVILTATVQTNGGIAAAAGGAVVFKENGIPLSTNPVVGGVAVYTNTTFALGSHLITAAYSGDAAYVPSESAQWVQVVQTPAQTPTATTLGSSPNPSVMGSNVTFIATVQTNGMTAASAGGTMVFKDGATALSTNPVSGGVAVFATSALVPGSRVMTAAYNGDAHYASSLSPVLTQVVHAATSTALVSSANPDGTFAFTATVRTNGVAATGATGLVHFKDGPTVLNSTALVGGGAAFATGNLNVGSHTLTAAYLGDANHLPSVSPPVVIAITNLSSVSYTVVTNSGATWSRTVALPEFAPDSRLLAHLGIINRGDAWDRGGRVFIQTPSGNVDLVTFVTGFGGTYWNDPVDVTALRSLLKGDVTFRGQIDQNSWGMDLNIEEVRGGNSGGQPLWAAPVISTGTTWTHGAFDAGPKSFSVNIPPWPAGMFGKIFLTYYATGHGGSSGTGCCEFNSLPHRLWVDGTEVLNVTPWRSASDALRGRNPTSGRWDGNGDGDTTDPYPTDTWSSDFARANWLPGDVVHPYVVDVTSALTPPLSGPHTVEVLVEGDITAATGGYWLAGCSITATAGTNTVLATNLINGTFEANNAAFFDATVDGWLEHETYGGGGPNGSGCGIWGTGGASSIPGTIGDQLSLIAGNTNANTATAMQFLGNVRNSDVGKTLTLAAGAVAWDWSSSAKPYSGVISLSFRTGATPDPGFLHGTLLGTPGVLTTGVGTAGDGLQNSIGDDGALKSLTASYTPGQADVGKPVFAVLDLGSVAMSPAGENRFVADDASLTVTPPPSLSSAVITNGGFDSTNNIVFEPLVAGWLEHEFYNGAGPNGSGCGIWPFFGATISNASGAALSLIPTDSSANAATVMRFLGTVSASDLGSLFAFSVGAVAWDWFPTVKPYSGTITISFRTGCVSDNGNTASFNYGSLLGTAASMVTGVTAAGDGVQNGIGDSGALKPLAASYTPTVGDIGLPVFAVINLGNATIAPAGENRFIVDNATFSVTPPNTPLRVTQIQRGANGAVSFVWTSQAGKTYSVQTSLGLTAWTNIATGIPAAGSSTAYLLPAGSNPDPASEPSMFFRVRQE